MATRVNREATGIARWFYEPPLKYLFLISPEKGADTLLWLIQGRPGRDWQPGEYYHESKPTPKNPQATPAVARPLWEASERLVGG